MLRFHQVTLDCRELEPTVTFWARALGQPVRFIADGWAATAPEVGHAGLPMLFQQVPEPKTAKSPVHLDLQAEDLAAEIVRLQELGATLLDERDGHDVRWAVLQDPAGNEFCVAEARPGHGATG